MCDLLVTFSVFIRFIYLLIYLLTYLLTFTHLFIPLAHFTCREPQLPLRKSYNSRVKVDGYQFRAGSHGNGRPPLASNVSARPVGGTQCPGGTRCVTQTRAWRSVVERRTHVCVTSAFWTFTNTNTIQNQIKYIQNHMQTNKTHVLGERRPCMLTLWSIITR